MSIINFYDFCKLQLFLTDTIYFLKSASRRYRIRRGGNFRVITEFSPIDRTIFRPTGGGKSDSKIFNGRDCILRSRKSDMTKLSFSVL